MNTLWQRFGRAARGMGRFAFAILLAEKDYFDGERERKAVLAARRKDQPSRKRKGKGVRNSVPSKRTKATLAPSATAAPTSPAEPSTSPSTTTITKGEAMDVDLIPTNVDADGMNVDVPEESGPEDEDAEGGAGQEGRAEEPEKRGDDEATVREEERRKKYGERSGKTSISARTVNRKPAGDFPEVLDDFINAEQRGLRCRRKVIELYYSNDKRGKY